MNILLDTCYFISRCLTRDQKLLLASAVAVFDPFWTDFNEHDIDYDTDPLTIGLHVTRGAFPAIYAEAVERLRAGAAYSELDRLICKGISAHGIPLDDLETIGWGIPLTAAGVDVEDPEFYAVHTELLPLLVPVGINITEGETYRVDVPEHVYTVGRAVAASLHQQSDPALRQVGWTFGWLFGCTGNSLVDYTDEMLSEIPPLSWSTEDIAFAIELIEEADRIMRDVQAGIETLKAEPSLMNKLVRNIAVLYLECKKKGRIDERNVRLEWSGAGERADGAAVACALVL